MKRKAIVGSLVLVNVQLALPPGEGTAPHVNCQMACCALCNVLVSTARLPNDALTKLPLGGSVIAPSTLHIAQQAI